MSHESARARTMTTEREPDDEEAELLDALERDLDERIARSGLSWERIERMHVQLALEDEAEGED